MKILFVCIGNICRSPCAHGILKHIDTQNQYEIESNGVESYHVGEEMDARMKKVLEKHNIFFSHKARKFNKDDAQDYDLILCMEDEVVLKCKRISPKETHHKIKLFREYDPNGNGDVPDPYYENNFEEVYEIINRTCENLYRQFP